MFGTAAMFISVIGFAIPAIAQDKEPRLPENTINCKQFKKTGAQEWTEVGTAVFDLGKINDINLTNQPVTPRYYKFDGVDLFDVVEQKCGAVAPSNQGNATASAPITLEQGAAGPKTELEPDKSASTFAQTPAQANISEVIPISENKIVKAQSESASCGERKSVYVADGLAGAEGVRASIQIAFNNKMNNYEKSSTQSEFLITKHSINKVEWTYKGRLARGSLIFDPVQFRQEKTLTRFTFTPVHLTRQKPVMLPLNYIKPNRDGTGEAILYLSGLRALFASKESVRRFKFEGNRPSELLPEAFYFDRCE